MNCGIPGSNTHHLIPLSTNGPDNPDYWILLCEKCHKAKGIHSEHERMFIELATKKFYAESLIQSSVIEFPPQASIIGPQRKVNLLHSRIPKVEPQAKTEASIRHEEQKSGGEVPKTETCRLCGGKFPRIDAEGFCSGTCKIISEKEEGIQEFINREFPDATGIERAFWEI